MLDLSKYLFPEDEYVIMRMSNEFPFYTTYSDVDILCRNTTDFSKLIKERHGHELKEHRPDFHHHLDYYPKEQSRLDLKFDLIDTTMIYHSLVQSHRKKVSQELFDNILDSSTTTIRKGTVWNIPTLEYETVLRYIEWLTHPNKTKHWEFYQKNRNEKSDKIISTVLIDI